MHQDPNEVTPSPDSSRSSTSKNSPHLQMFEIALTPEGTVRKVSANNSLQRGKHATSPLALEIQRLLLLVYKFADLGYHTKGQEAVMPVSATTNCYTTVCLESGNLVGKKIRGLHNLLKK